MGGFLCAATHRSGELILQCGFPLPQSHGAHREGKQFMSLGSLGATKLGIETVPPIITRGVLADIARYRGVRSLEPGEVITVTDLEGALRAQDVAVAPGDVLLFHTGWGALLLGRRAVPLGAL